MHLSFSRLIVVLFALLPAAAFAEPAPQEPGFGPLIFLLGFFVIFYFMVWRPQSKRQKEHKELVGGLGKGDEVVTSGGLLGKITKVQDDFLVLQIANNVEIVVQKHAVTNALPKGTLKEIQ